LIFFFLLLLRPPPTSTLFPYTTLFRSGVAYVVLQRNRHAGETKLCTNWIREEVKGRVVVEVRVRVGKIEREPAHPKHEFIEHAGIHRPAPVYSQVFRGAIRIHHVGKARKYRQPSVNRIA